MYVDNREEKMNNNLKEEINNYSAEDFENNLVNLHIHTTYSDGKADFKNIIEKFV